MNCQPQQTLQDNLNCPDTSIQHELSATADAAGQPELSTTADAAGQPELPRRQIPGSPETDGTDGHIVLHTTIQRLLPFTTMPLPV